MNFTSTMQFIELFRQHRALWDRNDVDYINKAERMRRREAIGVAMGMTEVDVGKKICNLRTYYLREMVKRDKAVMYGQTTTDAYEPKWPYFHALDSFLQDVVRKKRNEYLTAGGAFPDLTFAYPAEDHFFEHDPDNPDDVPNDNSDLTRDSHPGGGEGDGEVRRPSRTPPTSDITAGDNGDDSELPSKRFKLEPVEDAVLTCIDGEDWGSQGKDPSSQGLESETPGTCLGAGLQIARSSPFRIQPSSFPTPVSSQPHSSLQRLSSSVMRGPTPVQCFARTSSGTSLGIAEGPRMNGHSVGSGGGVKASGALGANPPGMVMVEEDDDWLFGRYIVAELKKIKSFKDKQLAKMKIQQIVTYAQLGMGDHNVPVSIGVDM